MASLLEKWRSWTAPSPCRELYRQYEEAEREHNKTRRQVGDILVSGNTQFSFREVAAYIQVTQEEMAKLKYQIEKDCSQK
jgi:hypothetical protein